MFFAAKAVGVSVVGEMAIVLTKSAPELQPFPLALAISAVFMGVSNCVGEFRDTRTELNSLQRKVDIEVFSENSSGQEFPLLK